MCKEKLTNFDRLFGVMDEAGIDAVVATSGENVVYTSGFWAMSQWARRTPQTYVLYPRGGRGEPAIITGSGLVDLIADQEPWVPDVRRFGYFQVDVEPDACLHEIDRVQMRLMERHEYEDSVDALVAAIRDNGLENATIGIDEVGIAAQSLGALKERLPNARFVWAAALLQKVRAIKTPEEIRRLRQAARIAELSIDAAFAIADEGVTEREFMAEFHRTTASHNGLNVSTCIGFGERSAMSNVQPSTRALRKGDAIRFDVGGRFEHYRSDISRCGVFGAPDDKLRTYHAALHAGIERAYEIIRPGLKVSDLFHGVVDATRANGIPHYKRNHVGHGIGVDGYDFPTIGPDTDAVLEADMVICVETPYYEFGFAGLQVEDMLRVTPQGAESFMSSDGRLRVIEP